MLLLWRILHTDFILIGDEISMEKTKVMSGYTTVTLDLDIRRILIAVLRQGEELHGVLKSEDDSRRRSGTDMYRNLAAWMSKVKPEEVSHEQRHMAKVFLFEYLYGKEECKERLASIETAEISDFVRAIGDNLPGVACYTRHTTQQYTAGFTFVIAYSSFASAVGPLLDIAHRTLPPFYNIDYLRKDGKIEVISSTGDNVMPEEPA